MIEIEFDTGDGAQWQYRMQAPAEQQLREFSEGRWTEILMVEAEPEIRRHRPVSFTIRRIPVASDRDEPSR